MRVIKKAFAVSFLIATLFSYALGWYDMYQNGWIVNSFTANIVKSFNYYVFWVLPYWLPINLIFSLVISLLCILIVIVYKRVRRNL